jgi:ribosomal protein S18 acetylase RimI-like enzyme
MDIKPVTPEHKKSLFNIHETCFRHHIEEIWGWDDMWQWDYFCKEWDQAKWRVILDENKIIGYLCWTIEPDHLYLKNISFIPEYQGRGLGKIAMAFIEDIATKNKLPINLSTMRTNNRVQKFYKNRGYQVTKIVETGIRMTKAI